MESSTRKPRGAGLSSVANAARIAKAFTDQEPELGISALANRLGLAKSTVHRLATTLVEHHLLEQNRENGKYRLGLAVFEMGMLVRRKMDVATEARPAMRNLATLTGETVQLAVLEGASVLYILVLESRQAVRMAASLGERAPAHCTAVGKALLAFQPPEVQRRFAGAPLAGLTARSHTQGAALLEELAQVRSRGHAFDEEEMADGLRCVAAPIRDHAGRVIAALSVAAPVQRLAKKALPATAASVMQAAALISGRLGYSPPPGLRNIL